MGGQPQKPTQFSTPKLTYFSPMTGRNSVAIVSARGAQRWANGHPWIFKSDVIEPPTTAPGAVTVFDNRRRPLGTALWSPASEISLRLLDPDPDATIDQQWWTRRIGHALHRRASL